MRAPGSKLREPGAPAARTSDCWPKGPRLPLGWPPPPSGEGCRLEAPVVDGGQQLAQIHSEARQSPLGARSFETADGEATEAVDPLHDAEDVLDNLFAQREQDPLVRWLLPLHLSQQR